MDSAGIAVRVLKARQEPRIKDKNAKIDKKDCKNLACRKAYAFEMASFPFLNRL